MKQPLFLRIYKDGQLQEIKQVSDDQVVFGSNDDVTVSLKDESVSPIHAMIESRESGYFLCDLGSSTGTLRNGMGVLDVSVSSGDEIQIGQYTIEFYVGVPKPKSRPPRTTDAAAPPPTAPKDKDGVYDIPTETGPKIVLEKEARPAAVEKPKPKPESPAKVEKPAAVQPVATAAPAPTVTTRGVQKESAKPEVQAAATQRTGQWQKVEAPGKSKSASGGLETHTSSKIHKSKFGQKTFAPPSQNKDLKQIIKPSKGTVVEIVVAWKERILSTYHYSDKKTVLVGSHPKNDIVLPVFGSTTVSHPLIKVDGAAKIFLTSDLRGDLVQGEKSTSLSELSRIGRAETSGAGFVVTLQQGELVRIDFADMVSVYIRYVPPAPKPIAAPIMDMSTTEISSIIGAVVFTLFIAFYFAVYTPPVIEEEKKDEPPPRATFTYKARIEPSDLSQLESKPSPEAKLSDKNTAQQEKAPVKAPTPQKAASREDEGKTGEAAPNKSKSQEKKLTTPNPGTGTGVKKGTAANKPPGAQGASAQKDVTKSGLLSVLSGRGAQDRLSQVYSGAGVVGGSSQGATGTGAQSAAGAGDTPGEGLKDIGKGGTGETSVGIAGVGTKGRGSGNTGYGAGGIGDKKSASVIPGGAEESFTGTIDRDAIRRVIQENMRQIKNCYEKGLNRDPGLFGKIVVAWTIGDRGVVTKAGIGSTTMNSSEVEQCIVSRFRTWRFPSPPAGQEADVTYPFVFSAQN